MYRVEAPIAELARFFEKGGAFEQDWKARPGFHLFPRAYLLRQLTDGFEANVSDGKIHILVRAQAQGERTTALSFDMRSHTLGASLGCLTVPFFGLGLFVLLFVWIKRRTTRSYAEREVLPIVFDHFSQVREEVPAP